MRNDFIAKWGAVPRLVTFSGLSDEFHAARKTDFIFHCDRCGHVQKEPVCEHCMEAIKPTMKIEQWAGFEVHSTVRHEGGNIWIDEVVYEPNSR